MKLGYEGFLTNIKDGFIDSFVCLQHISREKYINTQSLIKAIVSINQMAIIQSGHHFQ